MTNRERAERWVADRSAKGFYSETTTDSLTSLLDEVERQAFDAGLKRGTQEGEGPSQPDRLRAIRAGTKVDTQEV